MAPGKEIAMNLNTARGRKVRTLLVVLALVAGLAGLGSFTASPANADYVQRQATACGPPDSPANQSQEGICLTVFYERDTDNIGFKLDLLEIDGCNHYCSSVNGHSLTCVNQDGVVKWSASGAAIDLGHADVHTFTINQTWPGATILKCVWEGQWHYLGLDWFNFSDTVNRT
jgi:hypothetical protein